MIEKKRTASFSRRKFLQNLTVSGLAVGAGGMTGAAASTRRPDGSGGKARNILFFVSDGMNIGTLQMTAAFRSLTGGKPLAWLGLYDERPPGFTRALMDTASANSPVTDSSAAGSAWGGGTRVNNRSLNIDPRGRAHEPILVKAKRTGRKTGLVSTARITHATPASFAANTDSRDDEDGIAAQYLERGINLLIGGGNEHFDPARREDGRDMYAAYREAGYTVVRHRDMLAKAAAAGTPLLAVFGDSHLPYEIDRLHTPELRARVPSLATMTTRAIRALTRSGNGFVLQVEGARVDHGAHANDFAATIHDQLAFDDAVRAGLEFAAGRDDTLVIVTTDHGTGGAQLNGRGPAYSTTGEHFRKVLQYRASYEAFLRGLPLEIGPELFHRSLAAHLGFELPEDLTGTLAERLTNERTRTGSHGSGTWTLGGALRLPLLHETGVGWTSHGHTGDYVELAAHGPGAEAVTPFIRNDELHHVLTGALGITA